MKKSHCNFEISTDAHCLEKTLCSYRIVPIIQQWLSVMMKTHRSVTIFTKLVIVASLITSQAALKALSSTEVNSKLVWDCVCALNTLRERSNVTVSLSIMVRGHKGNKKAYEMVKQGSSMSFIRPKTLQRCKSSHENSHKGEIHWCNHAKKFIVKYSPKFTTYAKTERQSKL